MLLLLNEKENNSNDRRKKVNFKKQGQANERGKKQIWREKMTGMNTEKNGNWAESQLCWFFCPVTFLRPTYISAVTFHEIAL